MTQALKPSVQKSTKPTHQNTATVLLFLFDTIPNVQMHAQSTVGGVQPGGGVLHDNDDDDAHVTP